MHGIDVRVYGNGAYAGYQTLKDGIDTEVTSQVRVLRKRGGKWKIALSGLRPNIQNVDLKIQDLTS